MADARATIVALGDSTTAGTPGFLSPLESPPDGRGDVESQFAVLADEGAARLACAQSRRERGAERSNPRAIRSRCPGSEGRGCRHHRRGERRVSGAARRARHRAASDDVPRRVARRAFESSRARSFLTTRLQGTRTRGCGRSTPGSRTSRPAIPACASSTPGRQWPRRTTPTVLVTPPTACIRRHRATGVWLTLYCPLWKRSSEPEIIRGPASYRT